MPDLITLAEQGHVLIASWHADNPLTGQPSWDMTDRDKVTELTDPDGGSPAYDDFWGDWDEVIATVGQASRRGRADHPPPAARGERPVVLVGAPGPGGLQGAVDPAAHPGRGRRDAQRALALRRCPGHLRRSQDPLELLPEVDFAGIDTYDCEQPGTRAERLECGGGNDYADDLVDLTSYAELEGGGAADEPLRGRPAVQLRRVLGPEHRHDDAHRERLPPVYAMFWFDDQREGRPPMAKQLASLQGGTEWLASCPEALCDVSGGYRSLV